MLWRFRGLLFESGRASRAETTLGLRESLAAVGIARSGKEPTNEFAREFARELAVEGSSEFRGLIAILG